MRFIIKNFKSILEKKHTFVAKILKFMMRTFKRKVIILFVSFALGNVALHAIINFHFYRIFGKELAKIDNHFIKKDESYIIVKSFDLKNIGKTFDFMPSHYGNFGIKLISQQGFTIIAQLQQPTPVYNRDFVRVSPTRGSPFLS